MIYDFVSEGIQIKGDDSYHVVKMFEKDEWVLIRQRSGAHHVGATFSSPDEARALAHSLGLELKKSTV
jgi:hypothetical protein